MKSFKKIVAFVYCAVVIAPVLITFTGGSDGAPTSWNLIGVLYMLSLVVFPKKFFPSWVRTTVDSSVRDE